MAQGGYGGGGGYGNPPGGGAPPGAPGGYGAPPGAQGVQPTAGGGYGPTQAGYGPTQAGYGAPPGQAPNAGYVQPTAPQQAWGAAPGALGAGAGGAYEFNAPENAVIGTAGGRAAIWGLISIIGGGLLALAGILGIILGIVAISSGGRAGTLAGAALIGGGIVALTMSLQPLISGKFYMDAGRALKSVVDTQGNDIAHMMEALGKLRNAVRLEAIVAIVSFVLGMLMALLVVGLLVASMS